MLILILNSNSTICTMSKDCGFKQNLVRAQNRNKKELECTVLNIFRIENIADKSFSQHRDFWRDNCRPYATWTASW